MFWQLCKQKRRLSAPFLFRHLRLNRLRTDLRADDSQHERLRAADPSCPNLLKKSNRRFGPGDVRGQSFGRPRALPRKRQEARRS